MPAAAVAVACRRDLHRRRALSVLRLKHACLTLCQRPFPFFFANWTTEPRGVFQLGLRQGLYCLGCCWAMMLVMFAAGAMNVVWMAALGVIMTIEKMTLTTRFSPAVGVVLVAIGLGVVGDGFGASEHVDDRRAARGRSVVPSRASWRCRAIARCSVRACCRSAACADRGLLPDLGRRPDRRRAGSARPIFPA